MRPSLNHIFASILPLPLSSSSFLSFLAATFSVVAKTKMTVKSENSFLLVIETAMFDFVTQSYKYICDKMVTNIIFLLKTKAAPPTFSGEP